MTSVNESAANLHLQMGFESRWDRLEIEVILFVCLGVLKGCIYHYLETTKADAHVRPLKMYLCPPF